MQLRGEVRAREKLAPQDWFGGRPSTEGEARRYRAHPALGWLSSRAWVRTRCAEPLPRRSGADRQHRPRYRLTTPESSLLRQRQRADSIYRPYARIHRTRPKHLRVWSRSRRRADAALGSCAKQSPEALLMRWPLVLRLKGSRPSARARLRPRPLVPSLAGPSAHGRSRPRRPMRSRLRCRRHGIAARAPSMRASRKR